ncbi:hypothetical protein BXY70_1320 [Roseovarius halotolerans]|uniref:Phage-related minor tail protein n=1 Tax=Roseovarius halotolerans TaxID=505353 RepID=A0A1X6Y5K3_9RHOB|nr:hypothetical protein [Roseovarius halotolerans]RKT35287.1 hypothetical protein BXY70_1320 [Roseovarius halotolerans]SLN11218.1 hypothetical protein ROH8110_00076 [Roseovarius halotolerans]
MARKKPLVVAFVSDVAGAIKGARKLSGEVEKVGPASEEASKESEKALRSLGVKSESVANKQIARLRDQFETVKNSGVASAEEIARAQKTMETKIERINKSIGRSTEDTFKGVTGRVKKMLKGINISASDVLRVGSRGALIGAGLAAGAGAAAFASISNSADFADQLRKASRRSNVATEELSGLTFAAEQSGVGFEVLLRSLKNIDVNMRKKPDQFEKLGVAVRDAGGESRRTIEVFTDVIEALRVMEDRGLATASAAEILGAKAGPDLATLISIGKKGIEDYEESARRFGIVVTDDVGEAAERFNDRLDDLNQRFRGLRLEASAPFFDAFAKSFDGIGKFIDENRDKMVGFAKVISDGLLSVVEDLVAILEGRGGDVQNKWILELVEGAKTVGKVFTDVLIPAAELLLKLVEKISDRMSERGPINRLASMTPFGFLVPKVGGDAADSARNVPLTRQIEAAAGGRPININLDGQTYPMTASEDVAISLERDQRLRGRTSPTGAPRNNR